MLSTALHGTRYHHTATHEATASPDVRALLAGVGVDDPVGGHPEVQHGADLGSAGTVKAAAEGGQNGQEDRVVVALDSCGRGGAGEGEGEEEGAEEGEEKEDNR